MNRITLQEAVTPCQFDDEKGFTRIGLIVLASDLTSEDDFYQLCRRPGVRIHVTRTAYENPVTPANLEALKNGLAHSASFLVPDVPLQVIYFSCTAATALLGEAAVQQQIHLVKPGVPVITPLSAATEALKVLGARRLSILTPYTADVAEPVGNYFSERGFAVNNISYMGLEDDRVMARLATTTIVEMAKECMSSDSDALFISCTALRSAQVAGQIEEVIGRPVITSNQAAAWLAARISGLDPAGEEYGVLMFRKQEKQ